MTKTTWTFTTGCAINEEHFYVAASADIFDIYERFTSLYQWCPELEAQEEKKSPWFYSNVNWRCAAVTALFPRNSEDWFLCSLSEEGDVHFAFNDLPVEKISGAGVYSEGAQGWGYLADLQQIGDHLYACGYRGQVYKRFGPADWRHIDQGLLQAPSTVMRDNIALSVINGPHENAIYVAGYRHMEWLPPKAFFFNGEGWRELELPEDAERIVNMYIESETRIWMCGANGTLLLGNATDGFTNLSSIHDNQLFTSVCKFQELIYLASNVGLFVFDPAEPDQGIVEVVTGLTPELQDANIVDSYDRVLWSIGTKDIARFDGQQWERIDHPDNPPIR